jgi:hypothetical protein
MDPEQTPPIDPGPDPASAPAPDTATELAAVKAQMAELLAEREASKASTEAARLAGLSDAEKLAEERQGLAKEREALTLDRRVSALDKLGVQPKYRSFAPQVDPADPSGALALDKWAKENPELLTPRAGPGQPPPQAPEGSMLAKVLSGQVRHPFMSATGLSKLLGGNQ